MQETRQEPGSIEVGSVHFDPATAPDPKPADLLSSADQARAERFRRREDRVRFLLGRRLLAALLARTEAISAGPLELALTEHGRPWLIHHPEMVFSISHAGSVVAVALARGVRVGLDIEALDRRLELNPLAERIFSAADLARFRAVPEAGRSRAFFHAWTGKEAVLKARGVGLFGGLREIAVPFGEGPASVRLRASGETWHLTALPLPDGYAGFVACDQPRELQKHAFTCDDLLGT